MDINNQQIQRMEENSNRMEERLIKTAKNAEFWWTTWESFLDEICKWYSTRFRFRIKFTKYQYVNFVVWTKKGIYWLLFQFNLHNFIYQFATVGWWNIIERYANDVKNQIHFDIKWFDGLCFENGFWLIIM